MSSVDGRQSRCTDPCATDLSAWFSLCTAVDNSVSSGAASAMTLRSATSPFSVLHILTLIDVAMSPSTATSQQQNIILKQSISCTIYYNSITSRPWAVRLSWPEKPIHAHFRMFWGNFRLVNYIRLVWFWACHQGSLVGLATEDYKSLCAQVHMCYPGGQLFLSSF